MPAYTWITLAQAQAALAARLADPGNRFWTLPELALYLQEALRTWNAFTEQWNSEFGITNVPSATWYDLSTLSNSPRFRTLTDAYLYTLMQYHLLEPPNGAAAWTGTSQFTLSDLQNALQRRRDEMIQACACSLIEIPTLAIGGGSRRAFLPDTVLEPLRIRWMPVSPGTPFTMAREDSAAFDYFEANHLQAPGSPQAWSVVAQPPLAVDLDVVPNRLSQLHVLAVKSGPAFNPPAATLLGIPDDWSWVAKWGALGDLLGRESESTDRERADYCIKRYNDGVTAMRESNWLLSATIANRPVDTPSVRSQDGFAPNWENNASAWPAVVTAGIDLLAPCPVGSVGTSVVLVGNAPVPVNAGDFVQVSRDVFDVILDYSQMLASFKQGGEEFKSTADLEKNFMALAVETNKRLADLAIFRDMLGMQGKRQSIAQPR